MSEKLTFEFVKEEIERMHPGCELISKEYVNNRSKLDIICENSHKFKIHWNDIKSGYWCAECNKENIRKKLQFNYNYVKEYIENKYPGSQLLSKEYMNVKTELKILCENNHIFYANFNNLRRCKLWCPICNKTKKLTIEFVKEKIERMHPGCKVLSNEYINNITKLDIICKNNHKFKIHWASINNNTWCPFCKEKYTLQDVIDFINENHPDAQLLSKEYTNNSTKLEILCEKGHIFYQSFRSIRVNKSWCPDCCHNKKLSLEYVKEYLQNTHPKAKLLSTEYINSKTDLIFLCEKNHKFKARFNNIQNNSWCTVCFGKTKHSYNYVKEYIENKYPGSQLLSKEYINSLTKLEILCENNHNFKMKFNSLKSGQWCPKCKLSKGEHYCAKYLNILFNKSFPKVKPEWLRNPKTNYPLELDGFCEELKLAFEYQGYQHYIFPNRFHKTRKKFEEQQERDKIKENYCKENNIILLNIKQFKNLTESTILKNIFEELLKHPELLKHLPCSQTFTKIADEIKL